MATDRIMRRHGRQRLVRAEEVKAYSAAGWVLDPSAVQPKAPAKPKAKRKAQAKRRAKTKPEA